MATFHRSPGQGPTGPLGRIESAATFPLAPAEMKTPLRYFGSYALVLLERGWARYRDEWGRIRRLEGGDLVIVLPRFGHRYEGDPDSPEPTRHTYVVFDGPLPELWERSGWISPEHALLPGVMSPDDSERLLSLLRGRDAVDELTRLQALLAELLDGRAHFAASDAWLENAQRLLAQNLDQPMSLPAIARAMGLSYPAFRRRFKASAGISPGRFRAQRVIAQATQLMAATDLSDKQIAHQLGFTNPSYFSRRFTQLTGETPTEHRRRLLQPRLGTPSGGE